jgi:hypothetical protein
VQRRNLGRLFLAAEQGMPFEETEGSARRRRPSNAQWVVGGPDQQIIMTPIRLPAVFNVGGARHSDHGQNIAFLLTFGNIAGQRA